MNLKARFLLLTATLMIGAALASLLMFNRISEGIIERWGRQVAEIQVRYDSARLLQSLAREIALAKQMADSSLLQAWAQDQTDEQLKQQALAELESYRRNFQGSSYFVAFEDTGDYYYNSAENHYADDQYRYTLQRENPDDAWFYRLIEEQRDFHLNVNPDKALGVTKLWVDVLLRNGDDILGIVGTGLNLESFLREIVDLNQDGITTLFVDYNGAIQLYRDSNYIDFASIVKPEGQKNTIDMLFASPEDGAFMLGMLEELRQGGGAGEVKTGFVNLNGKRHLAGVVFLEDIGWFEITFLDLATLLPARHLDPLIIVSIIALLAALLIFQLSLGRQILQPLAALEQAVLKLKAGDTSRPQLPQAVGEIASLNRHFRDMAAVIQDNTLALEEKVRERTEKLHQLARTDSLTGLLNRRGMDEVLAAQMNSTCDDNKRLGLLLFDLDEFKQINDSAGHGAGDQVLRTVAHTILRHVGPSAYASRWGGDEFLVLVPATSSTELVALAELILAAVKEDLAKLGYAASMSAGGCLRSLNDKADSLLTSADQALYAAKQSGRNCIRMGRVEMVATGGLEPPTPAL